MTGGEPQDLRVVPPHVLSLASLCGHSVLPVPVHPAFENPTLTSQHGRVGHILWQNSFEERHGVCFIILSEKRRDGPSVTLGQGWREGKKGEIGEMDLEEGGQDVV